MITSLRETKTRLSEYVQLVEKGEDIIITVRGKPKARLTAIREPQGSVEYSTDLNTWTSEAITEEEIAVIDDYALIKATIPVDTDDQTVFVRLKVRLSD